MVYTDKQQNKQGVVFQGTEGWVYVCRGHIDVAVRSDTISHLTDICTRLKRKIRWDPDKEEIVGDAGCLYASMNSGTGPDETKT